MTQKTNTTAQPDAMEVALETEMTTSHMAQDLKSAVLIVSVVANLFILTAWIAMQVTTQFDSQIAVLLFNR